MRTFHETLSALRRERGINQRTAAAELNISQALLSHYETGAREPGLAFVCRVCDYYGVSADYLLCRSEDVNPGDSAVKITKELTSQLRSLADRADASLDEALGRSVE